MANEKKKKKPLDVSAALVNNFIPSQPASQPAAGPPPVTSIRDGANISSSAESSASSAPLRAAPHFALLCAAPGRAWPPSSPSTPPQPQL